MEKGQSFLTEEVPSNKCGTRCGTREKISGRRLGLARATDACGKFLKVTQDACIASKHLSESID